MTGASRCPCALAVPLDYSGRNTVQARAVQQIIAALGEWTTVTVAGKSYRVSRHCIALHGIVADEIENYGFAVTAAADDRR